VASRPEVERYITQNMHEEMTPAQIHAQEALARVLGVVPRNRRRASMTPSARPCSLRTGFRRKCRA
jgi:hypothetical protein